MKVNIYIASSIRGLRRTNGVVGYVIEADTSKGAATLTQFGSVKDVTENQSELIALKNALTRIKPECEITLWTENQYIRSAFLQGWLKGWQSTGWKNSKGKPVANEKEWREVAESLSGTSPEVMLGQDHVYKNYLTREVERRAKKYV